MLENIINNSIEIVNDFVIFIALIFLEQVIVFPILLSIYTNIILMKIILTIFTIVVRQFLRKLSIKSYIVYHYIK